MTASEALSIAIEAMRRDRVLFEPPARDWRRYGETLAFNKQESRRAAAYCDQLTEAIAVLEQLLKEHP